tara:strand:- start:421 stop:612 length:192 start_codon:yes stop_codon:yes gene_type:complete
MEKRIIQLPRGGNLEVDLTPSFLNLIVDHFDLENVSQVSDDHIRMFIYGSTRSAFEKADVNLD